MVKIGDLEIGEFPILLAPMEDVSDPPFRKLCKRGGADLMFTEFISSEGLIRNAQKSVQKLDIFEFERPIGIQIFGNNIASMKEATQIASSVNPDIIDINYGCPVKKVTCKGGGAAILQDIPKMVKMTSEIVKSTHLPVTVKTRLGWDENSKYIVEVSERLQDVGIKAISIHGRTRKQMYKGEACWELIRDVKNNPRMHIPVFGNGDVTCPKTAKEKKERYHVDGIMVGRGAIGNPWVFKQIKHYLEYGKKMNEPGIIEKANMALEHLKLSIKWKGEKLGVLEMRRHYSNYFRGIPKIKNYRSQLVETNEYSEIEKIINAIKLNYPKS
ncbi:MAG: tRNA dihydrouridine synthase DusB [Flavobacteriales bacterium]|nr:tRNA dihydrouridine synthase DusB [Flavobacteriales bacterium]|tara:strand:- start:4429 stop:5412 length:984 start_codon:yes stop_codon:yes gene_type:complete